jgi:hypothetical protein
MESLRYVVLISLALAACTNGQNLSLTATNSINFLYVDGYQITPLPNYADWRTLDTVPIDYHARLVAIRANNVLGGCSGLLVATVDHPLGYTFVSDDTNWVCSASAPTGWERLGFDDSLWTPAFQVGQNQGVTPGCPWIPINGIPSNAFWIWTPAHTDGDMVVSCRGYTPICDYGLCQNGATCQSNAADLCKCPVRWGGKFCEEPINECDSNPCQHGGLCELTDQGYTCQCTIGYTGRHCETDVTDCASSPCQNGATCVFNVEGGYGCVCVPGFEGVHCEIDIDECESDPCLNNATCIDVINGVSCECLPGYTGILCQNEIDECGSSPCQYLGTCLDGLDGYECQCQPGYEGANCETPVGDCVQNPCQNGGTCTLGGPDGAVECICTPGWFGPLCDSNENECVSNPCQNGGTCVDGDHRFDCNCPPEFSGETCAEVAPDCGSIMAHSTYAPTKNFWALCEINIIDHPSWTNTPCNELIVDIPYYNNSATILALGGTFGCYVTKFPDEVTGACVPGYNQAARLATCLSCTHMGVCIDVPPPRN